MYTDEYYTFTTIKAIESLRNRIKAIDEDPNKENRIKELFCRYCYYARRGDIAGQGFTNYKCGLCDKMQSWSNTNVPRVCRECAIEKNVCIRCRGNIELYDQA